MKKILIIDTSVLLYDKESIHSFPDNDVVIPMTVLEELDRFKDKQTLVGESARYVNRYLDDLRSLGRLDEGVVIENSKQTIQIVTTENTTYSEKLGLESSKGDNKIIAAALEIKSKNPDRIVKLITKDINMRVKCDAVGLQADDYYRDYISIDFDESDFKVNNFTIDSTLLDQFYANGFLSFDDLSGIPETKQIVSLHANCPIVLSGTLGGSAIAVVKKDRVVKSEIRGKMPAATITPRNKEQRFALDFLTDPEIPLVCVTGIAGSGKTFITLMTALNALNSNQFERIIVTRSVQPVGKDIGFLPGDLQEKMAPWMSPLVDNFRHAFKDLSYFNMMIEKGQIEIAPLSFIRGRSFNNSFVIVDEAQNTTIHELKTIVTRVGENTKIVLMGDTDQVDTPYIDSKSNGLTIAIDKLKSSELVSHIHLPKGERSKLATFCSKVL